MNYHNYMKTTILKDIKSTLVASFFVELYEFNESQTSLKKYKYIVN